MKRKVVNFKDSEEHLLNHALKQNFQEYIKKLIEYDMQHDILKPYRGSARDAYIDWMSRNVWKG